MGAHELHPDFPVAEGRHPLDREWSLFLPAKFNRRTADGNLVLWRPGLTAWVAIWSNAGHESVVQRVARIRNRAAADAAVVKEIWRDRLRFLIYRPHGPIEDERGPTLYCFVVADSSHIELAVHFDHERDVPIAESICASVRNARLERMGFRG